MPTRSRSSGRIFDVTVSNVTQNLVTSADILKIDGMSTARLRAWCSDGYLVVHHKTNTNYFLPKERDVARIMVALIEAGVNPDAAHRAARNEGWLNDSVRVVIGPRSALRTWKSLAGGN